VVSRSAAEDVPAGDGEDQMTARFGGWTAGAWSGSWRALTYLASLRRRRVVRDLTRRRSWTEQAREAPTLERLMERKAALSAIWSDDRR